jgi:hypothetical protein
MWKCNMFYIKNRDVVYCTHVNSPEMEYCIRCGFNRCLDIPWALQLKGQDRIYQCNICRRHGVLNEHHEHQICHHCSGPLGFKGYVWNCWKCDYNNPIVLRKCTECDTSREMTFVKREFMWKCDLCHYINPFTSEDCYQCKHMPTWELEFKAVVPQIRFCNFERNVTNDTCPICFLHFDSTKYVANLPCGHAVCKECLQMWIDQLDKPFWDDDPTCPYCKQSFELDWFVIILFGEYL